MEQRDPRTPVEIEEHARLPKVWFFVLALVGLGIVAHILISVYWSGAIVIWPFIFAVAVLLIVNDASDQNAVGVPPFQAYALLFGVLIAFFLFVALVSTINPWVVVAATLGLSAFLVRDWIDRRAKEKELDRRRAARLCVKCCRPVSGTGIEDCCPYCGTPVNPERLSLFQIGRAIGNRAKSQRTRQVLTGTQGGKAAATAQRLSQQSAYRYKRK